MNETKLHPLATGQAGAALALGGFAISVVGLFVNLWLGLGIAAALTSAYAWLHAGEIRDIARGKLSSNLILPSSLLLVMYTITALAFLQHDRDVKKASIEEKRLEDIQYQVDHPMMTASEMDELRSINAFICEKDEFDLRREFDFTGMLHDNIEVIRKNKGPLRADQPVHIAHIFADDQYLIVNPNHLTDGGLMVGGRDWMIMPGAIGYIILSDNYTRSRSKLDALGKSASVPADVRRLMAALGVTVDVDLKLMLHELNVYYSADHKYLLEASDEKSLYSTTLYNSYTTQMTPLRPGVDAICSAVGLRLHNGRP